jgi:hypothetical protein
MACPAQHMTAVCTLYCALLGYFSFVTVTTWGSWAQEPRDDELHEITSQTLTILKVKAFRQRWCALPRLRQWLFTLSARIGHT